MSTLLAPASGTSGSSGGARPIPVTLHHTRARSRGHHGFTRRSAANGRRAPGGGVQPSREEPRAFRFVLTRAGSSTVPARDRGGSRTRPVGARPLRAAAANGPDLLPGRERSAPMERRSWTNLTLGVMSNGERSGGATWASRGAESGGWARPPDDGQTPNPAGQRCVSSVRCSRDDVRLPQRPHGVQGQILWRVTRRQRRRSPRSSVASVCDLLDRPDRIIDSGRPPPRFEPRGRGSPGGGYCGCATDT